MFWPCGSSQNPEIFCAHGFSGRFRGLISDTGRFVVVSADDSVRLVRQKGA
jgi:hypothetical protein